MKQQIVTLLIGISTLVLVGYNHTVTTQTAEHDKTADKMADNSCLDMTTVIGYDGIINGLQLYTEDGNGCYLETENKQSGAIQLYHVATQEDHEALIPILEQREGQIIIEVSNGTVLDADGNGVDDCGYYIHYDMNRFSIGDYVQSVFIYNPETNYIDDIVCRMDILIE